MLLCEAQLGNPMLELTNADYHAAENCKKNGSLTTLGLGRTVPQKWMDAGEVNSNLKGIQMVCLDSLSLAEYFVIVMLMVLVVITA